MENTNLNPLYPERPSEGIEDEVIKLAQFENGEAKKLELSESERTEILTIEGRAGQVLESIDAIVTQSNIFFADYFLTSEGRKDFEDMTGSPLPDSLTSESEVQKFLLQSENLKTLGSTKRTDLAGRSRNHDEEARFQAIKATRNADGEIDVTGAPFPSRISILFTPESNRQKLALLRAFKSNLKHYTENHPHVVAHESPDFRKAFLGVVRLYISRTNDLIIDQNSALFALETKRDLLGDENLSHDEQKLLEKNTGSDNPERTLARYDKFLFGASLEYDPMSGERDQVSADLTSFADELEAEYIESTLYRNDEIASQGLDAEKIAEKEIPIEEVTRLAEETLQAYGLLSAHPASEFSKDRPGPAPDGKWQFVARDSYKTMAVDTKRKVIKTSRAPQSVSDLISVTLAHEIEGHVLQGENQSRIPLKLFDVLGGGRSAVFSECGAMNNQDRASREAFGFASPPHPHYIRAMECKLRGGDYLDCVKAFYDSALKVTVLKQSLGKLTPDAFEEECDNNLKLAINRTKRLFASGSSFTSEAGLLTKSKDTVYLEQVKLYQVLKKHNLEKYVFVQGANLNTLLFLMEAGFLNPDDIQKPQFHALDIWERMKPDYVLTDTERN